MACASLQPTTKDETGGAPQTGHAPSPDRPKRFQVKLRGGSCEMHFQYRGGEQVLRQRASSESRSTGRRGQALFGPLQSAALTRSIASRALSGITIPSDRAQKPAPCLVEGRVTLEAGTIERRHSELTRAGNRIGGDRRLLRQAVLEAMLNVAKVGEKDQIRFQRTGFRERTQAFGAPREHRRGIGQPRKRRFGNVADWYRVMLRRNGLRHTPISRTTRAT